MVVSSPLHSTGEDKGRAKEGASGSHPGVPATKRERKTMDIHSCQLSLQEIAEGFNPSPPRDESKVHVSDLRDALLEILGRQKREAEVPDWVKNLGSFGLIWEQVLVDTAREIARQRGLWFRKGTLIYEVDGVVGSLDGLAIQPHILTPVAVWECKTRWKAEELPTDNEKYMIQAKAYCWMAGVSQCWFPMLNIATRPPNMIQWLHVVDFSAQELMENWQSLLKMKPMTEKRKLQESALGEEKRW
jgi:hypothetical protein